MSRKLFAGILLVLIGVAIIFAVVSFTRQNWGADEEPGSFESLIARWFLSGAREPQENVANPITATPEHLEEGSKLYQDHCAVCHGQDGSGSAQTGLQFYPPVPSLIESSQRLTDGQLHAVITRGVRYTGMPSFAKALTPEQIWTITLWLRRLPAPAPVK